MENAQGGRSQAGKYGKIYSTMSIQGAHEEGFLAQEVAQDKGGQDFSLANSIA